MPITHKKYLVLPPKRKAPPPDQPASLPGCSLAPPERDFSLPNQVSLEIAGSDRIVWNYYNKRKMASIHLELL